MDKLPNRFLLALTLPIRLYIRYFPFHRGKGILIRWIILPSLPDGDSTMLTDLPHGGRIRLRYQEALGYGTLIYGGFEKNEQQYLSNYVNLETTVLDVGANVGLYSIFLALQVGDNGNVISFEPIPSNVSRLQNNLKLNNICNVTIHPVAVGQAPGLVNLNMADDTAFASMSEIENRHETGESIQVPVDTIDRIWKKTGKPQISFVKLDIEGEELHALEGAKEMLERCLPIILLEANNSDQLQKVRGLLFSLGYNSHQPIGFSPHNYIFSTETNI